MPDHRWIKEFPGAITVCDREGTILALNDRAEAAFEADGGARLIGANLLDCHPAPARAKVAEMLSSGCSNIYTIEKNGRKELIYQSPWYENGVYAGFIELHLEVPPEMPHFVRD